MASTVPSIVEEECFPIRNWDGIHFFPLYCGYPVNYVHKLPWAARAASERCWEAIKAGNLNNFTPLDFALAVYDKARNAWCFGVIYLLARSHNNPQSLRQWLEHTDFVINATMEVCKEVMSAVFPDDERLGAVIHWDQAFRFIRNAFNHHYEACVDAPDHREPERDRFMQVEINKYIPKPEDLPLRVWTKVNEEVTEGTGYEQDDSGSPHPDDVLWTDCRGKIQLPPAHPADLVAVYDKRKGSFKSPQGQPTRTRMADWSSDTGGTSSSSALPVTPASTRTMTSIPSPMLSTERSPSQSRVKGKTKLDDDDGVKDLGAVPEDD